MCYHVKFGSSMAKGVGINRKEPPKLRSAGTPSPWDGVWQTPINKPPAHMCFHVKFGSSASKGVCINRREAQKSAWKFWPLASCLSRSLKVIGTDTDRSAIYHFLLTFRSKWTYLVPFPREMAISVENCYFFPPLSLSPRGRGPPSNW